MDILWNFISICYISDIICGLYTIYTMNFDEENDSFWITMIPLYTTITFLKNNY